MLLLVTNEKTEDNEEISVLDVGGKPRRIILPNKTTQLSRDRNPKIGQTCYVLVYTEFAF